MTNQYPTLDIEARLTGVPVAESQRTFDIDALRPSASAAESSAASPSRFDIEMLRQSILEGQEYRRSYLSDVLRPSASAASPSKFDIEMLRQSLLKEQEYRRSYLSGGTQKRGFLEFRFGTVASGKSTHLLVAIHAYKTHDKHNVMLITSGVDTRNGRGVVWSRVPGLQRHADVVLKSGDDLPDVDPDVTSCVFVDECQFLCPAQIEQLWFISTRVPVICYGLRTDYMGELFPASAKLMALADNLVKIESICHYCGEPAMYNLKLNNGKPTFDSGRRVEIGAEDLYVPGCSKCVIEFELSEN